MFNIYTKMATALGAFALLFSTGAWSQCDSTLNEVSVQWIVGGGLYGNEISYQLNNADGENFLTDTNEATGTLCLPPGTYTFSGVDSYGDGWNGNVASFTANYANGDVEVLNYTISADSCLDAGCSTSATFEIIEGLPAIPGCTDPLANNYNPDATEDDGSCCTGNVLTFTLSDSYGDGWSVGPYCGTWGGIIFNGTDSVAMDELGSFGTPNSMSFTRCFDEGCYTAQIVVGCYAGEASWSVSQGETLINNDAFSGFGSAGDSTTFYFYAGSGACVVYGCTDALACNYDPLATFDDSTCETASCEGCTDPSACNYNDGSDGFVSPNQELCDFSCVGCKDETAANYCADCTIDDPESCILCDGIVYQFTINDSYGDGICCTYGEGSYTISLEGEVVASGGEFDNTESATFCANTVDACVAIDLIQDNYPFETTWLLSNLATGDTILESPSTGPAAYGSFYTSDCVGGCTEVATCNYDAAADYNDGSCDISCIGCTDETADNYNPNATIDGGSCVFCEGGEFILTVDMADSGGDGWNGAEYLIYSLEGQGDLVSSGNLNDALEGDTASFGTDYVCLAPGCYNFQILGGTSLSQASAELTGPFNDYGTVAGGDSYSMDFLITGQCGFEGCTDEAANNYDISATVDDGSCLIPPANDNIADAEAIGCGITVSGSLANANDNEGLIGTQFNNEILSTGGVWYIINSDGAQQITMSTCSTDDGGEGIAQATDIAIFTMDDDGNLTAIAANNNGCETGSHSQISWIAGVGDYYVRVEGFNGAGFTLEATCNTDLSTSPSNDVCEGAVALISGETITGNTCGANAVEFAVPAASGGRTAYGQFFTMSGGNGEVSYDDFLINVVETTDLGGENIGFASLGGDCDSTDFQYLLGGVATGTVELSTGGYFIPEDGTDYYFIVFTTEALACGDFELTITGIIEGCTDPIANNYDMNANENDFSCDYDGIVPANDSCSNALPLLCNQVTSGSTGGATSATVYNGVDGCDVTPGPGLWYTFEGDSSFHMLNTCGSEIDSKISIYTVDTTSTEAEACLLVTHSIEGGSYSYERGYFIISEAGDTVAEWIGNSSFGSPSAEPISLCLTAGEYTYVGTDSYGDGWNGGIAEIVAVSGNTIATFNADGAFSSGSSYEFGTFTIGEVVAAEAPCGDLNCVLSASSSGINGICTIFNDDDVEVSFVSEPGLTYYVYIGAEGGDGEFDIDFSCEDVVEGCTDESACNYDPMANVDDNSCEIWSCVCPDSTGTAIQLQMSDEDFLSDGDGWNGAIYTIADFDGTVYATGSLDEAFFQLDEDNVLGAEFGYDMLCLQPGCYNIAVTDGDSPWEISWAMVTEDGTILADGGTSAGETFSIGGAVCGCTDEGACNYDSVATDDDGSCEYTSCAGCTDETAQNYDMDALIDDASCCYDILLVVELTDSGNNGWNGAEFVISNVDGTQIGGGTLSTGNSATVELCATPGCYSIDVTSGSVPSQVGWSIDGAFGGLLVGGAGESLSFNVGSPDACVTGCDVACACNYNPDTNIPDVTLCEFDGCSGCTYEEAPQYDELAVVDDGTCTFDIANPCPADLNNDGSVSTADLLEFLTAFGQICE